MPQLQPPKRLLYSTIHPFPVSAIEPTAINPTSFSISIVNADGSNDRILSSGQFPAWAPDSKWIAYADNFEGIILLNADTLKRVTIGYRGSMSPSWLPKENRLVFSDGDIRIFSSNHIE